MGRLLAKFGHGPKSKVAAHIMLYNFYLRCTAIRAMDKRLTVLQSESVSALIEMNKSPKIDGQNEVHECHLVICSSP